MISTVRVLTLLAVAIERDPALYRLSWSKTRPTARALGAVEPGT
jgi:hypothetical protein